MDVLKAGLNVLTHLFMKEYLFHLTCLMLGFKKKTIRKIFYRSTTDVSNLYTVSLITNVQSGIRPP